MPRNFSDSELAAYLDEVLPVEHMSAVEEALRENDALQQRLVAINGRRDAGVHSIGEIWRRHRLSCPTREKLGSYLLGVLSNGEADYVRFHLDTAECRYCAASVADLRAQQSVGEAEHTQKRRHRYFHSSAGYLRKQD